MSQNGSPILDDFLTRNRSTFEQLPQRLGPNWETVLDFWKFRSSLTVEQITTLRNRFQELILFDGALPVAYTAALSIIGRRNQYDAWAVTPFPEYAAHEIIAMHKLIEDGYTFQYLPLFENL